MGTVWDPTSSTGSTDELSWCAFVVWVIQRRSIAAMTAQKYMNGIRHILAQMGFRPSFHEMELLRELLRGARKQARRAPKRKLPISRRVVESICNQAGKEDLGMQGILQFGFFALARLAELVGTPERGSWKPRVSDCSIEGETVSLAVPRSKTDIFREGVTLRASGAGVAKIMKALVHGRSASAPLFPSKSSGRAILRGEFISWLRAKGQLSPRYGGHSLRRGGACYYYARGMPLEVLKRKGRWRSDAWEAYVNTALRDEAEARRCV